MSDRDLYCDVCEGATPFEAPLCGDDHGTDCPELVCVRCGNAVLIATFAFRAARLADHHQQQRRPAHRRAA
ncbi:hypothetical protein V6V47_23565 [Micromonospora sp. CPCC 205539]|uniref:hypothetical protein n=1 Tax=Micromonospora sp. CPCC 205539 TaxID=3122408 RepID=UPI002FF21BF1